MKTALKKLKNPTVALSLVGAAGLLWAATRGGRADNVLFTAADGGAVAIRGRQIFAIHPSPYELRGQPMVRLNVLGLDKPVDVRETLVEVIHRVGGDWARLEGIGSWLGCSAATVPVLIDASRVVAIDESGMRRARESNQLTDVQMEGGYKVRVTENLQQVRNLLRM